MKTAFCFPGQGSQTVGMGVAFADASPAAAAVFAEASEAFGADLLELCRSGPQERLDVAGITQPALHTASGPRLGPGLQAGSVPASRPSSRIASCAARAAAQSAEGAR